MKKIAKFIDYFPMENSFVIPVFIDDSQNFFLQNQIGNDLELIPFRMEESSEKNINQDRKTLLENKLKAFSYLDVNSIEIKSNSFIHAFKVNTNIILMGSIKDLLESLSLCIGTFNGNLSMYDEIASIMINQEIDFEKISYFTNIARKTYLSAQEMIDDNLQDKFSRFNLPDLKNIKMIINKKEVVDFNSSFMLFRNIEKNPDNKTRKNFQIEIDRIDDFRKTLINFMKNSSRYEEYISLFE